jgi:hypothetical protein
VIVIQILPIKISSSPRQQCVLLIIYSLVTGLWHRLGTSKSKVVSRGVRSVWAASSTPVPIAVVLVAHKRSTLLDLVLARFGGSLRILVHLERIMPDGPPVRGPLPGVAHHIVKPKLVRRELGHGAGAGEPVLDRVLGGEGARPDVGPEVSVDLSKIIVIDYR